MDIAVVVGNPKPRSRTQHVANAVADALRERLGGRISISVDLADHASRMFSWPDADLEELSRRVASADIAVIASPTFKATYTGLLKSYLDRFPANGLQGVVMLPILTMASPSHALSVELGFRSLLVELGATVPSRGLAFHTDQIGELEPIVTAWTDANLPLIARMFPENPAYRP
jgi:FMN reductase